MNLSNKESVFKVVEKSIETICRGIDPFDPVACADLVEKDVIDEAGVRVRISIEGYSLCESDKEEGINTGLEHLLVAEYEGERRKYLVKDGVFHDSWRSLLSDYNVIAKTFVASDKPLRIPD